MIPMLELQDTLVKFPVICQYSQVNFRLHTILVPYHIVPPWVWIHKSIYGLCRAGSGLPGPPKTIAEKKMGYKLFFYISLMSSDAKMVTIYWLVYLNSRGTMCACTLPICTAWGFSAAMSGFTNNNCWVLEWVGKWSCEKNSIGIS